MILGGPREYVVGHTVMALDRDLALGLGYGTFTCRGTGVLTCQHLRSGTLVLYLQCLK